MGRPKPQITCNDAITHFQKRNFLCDKDIVKWKIRSRGLCVWHLTRILLKREGTIKLIAKLFKAGDTSSKLVQLKCIADGDLGSGDPSRQRLWRYGGEACSSLTSFCNFLKKSNFNAIGSHFARV